VLTRRGSARETLILIHGLGDSAEVWRAVIDHPALAEYGCIAVDLPGFGNSPQRPEGHRSIIEGATNLADMLGTYRDHGVVLVGHSLGGVVATLMAEAEPSWLTGVVNIEGNLTAADCTISREAAEASDIDTWLHDFRDRMIATPMPWAPEYGARLAGVDHASFLSAAVDLVALSTDSRIGDRYCSLAVPHLFIRGTRDFSADSIALLEHRHQGQAVIDGAGHWVMREDGDAFCSHLAAFVADLGTPAR